jgi:formylglycine-generating enzyme required for sulfatase activity
MTGENGTPRAAARLILLAVAAVGCAHTEPDRPPVERAFSVVARPEPKSGLQFVWLEGGKFRYGCEPRDSLCGEDEKPARSASVGAFWMGKTTVTVAAYSRCVLAGACTETGVATVEWPQIEQAEREQWTPFCNWGHAERQSHPMNCVSWDQAAAFCAWIGGRLPTAEEWEYAAKGGLDRIYPWGDSPPSPLLARFGVPVGGTAPAASYEAGASRHQLLNMAGNVWQWTGSDYHAKYKEVRGGSCYYGPEKLRASNRGWNAPSARIIYVGFRCAVPSPGLSPGW